MNRLTLPEVRQALEAILAAAQKLRLKQPELPPLRRLQEARRYCVGEVLTATVAIMKAEEFARFGPWARPSVSYAERQGLEARQERLRRYTMIRAIAVEHPDWSRRQLAKHFGVAPDTVKRALCDGAAA